MTIIKQLLLTFLLVNLYNCSKEKPEEPLNISYQAYVNVNNTDVISDIIHYSEIIGYDSSNYTFLIDDNAAKKIKKYYFPSGGLPFTLNVYGETVYTGKFFPAYSQVTPYGIIIDPYTTGNKLTVKIEYGFFRTDNQLIDNRNDKRIIEVLKKDQKLIITDP